MKFHEYIISQSIWIQYNQITKRGQYENTY